MFRKELLRILQENYVSLSQLAREQEMTQRELEDDLRHLFKSIRHGPHKPVIIPARCRKCGFSFSKDKLRKPGKCPQCHGTWISEPLIRIE